MIVATAIYWQVWRPLSAMLGQQPQLITATIAATAAIRLTVIDTPSATNALAGD